MNATFFEGNDVVEVAQFNSVADLLEVQVTDLMRLKHILTPRQLTMLKNRKRVR